jgi:formylglycine-generating enzyme required for sulfatase activity
VRSSSGWLGASIILILSSTPLLLRATTTLGIEPVPDEHRIRLTVSSGSQGGYLLLSSNLVDWVPWAAFPPGLTNLSHTASTAPSADPIPVSYFKVLPETVPVPDGFVFIPPGQFLMGSPETEIDRNIDENQHPATVHRGFWISRTEITIRRFLQVVPAFPTNLFQGRNPESAANFVSWQDAVEFCRRLTLTDTAAGRIPVGSSYRLPTETEWEYAARAGTTTRYFFGDDPDYTLVGYFGWYGTNAGGRIHPVGELPPNQWGLYDVHGNLFEWCLDPHTPYPGSSLLYFRRKIYRGGSFYCPARVLRSADRSHNGNLDYRDSLVGFRPVIGYHPDSLRTIEEMAPPILTLDWSTDHQEARLTLTGSSSVGTIEIRTLFPIYSGTFFPYQQPLLLTNRVSMEARVVKPATVVSELLIIKLERASPPINTIVDENHVTLSTIEPDTQIQFRELPNGPWLLYPEGLFLNRDNTWTARSWHPDKFTSAEMQFDPLL